MLIQYVAPLLVAVTAHFVFKERLRARAWIALVLAMAGLELVSRMQPGVVLDPVGLIYAGVAAVCMAVYLILSEKTAATSHRSRRRRGWSHSRRRRGWSHSRHWRGYCSGRSGRSTSPPSPPPSGYPSGWAAVRWRWAGSSPPSSSSARSSRTRWCCTGSVVRARRSPGCWLWLNHPR